MLVRDKLAYELGNLGEYSHYGVLQPLLDCSIEELTDVYSTRHAALTRVRERALLVFILSFIYEKPEDEFSWNRLLAELSRIYTNSTTKDLQEILQLSEEIGDRKD